VVLVDGVSVICFFYSPNQTTDRSKHSIYWDLWPREGQQGSLLSKSERIQAWNTVKTSFTLKDKKQKVWGIEPVCCGTPQRHTQEDVIRLTLTDFIDDN